MICIFFGCIVCSLRCEWQSYAKTLKLLFLGRRRSSRLIESPWVYNWVKKKHAFVTIDNDGHSCKAPGIVSGGTLLKKKIRGSVFGKSQVEGSTLRPSLDIRSERMEADRMLMRDHLEEDDEFVIPREHFSSSAKKAAGQTGRVSGCSGLSAKTCGQTASGGKQLRSQVCN